MNWSIDGVEWKIPCNIERVAEITASDISGVLLDKSYFNDVIGTYLRYTITLVVPLHMLQEYAQLYEKLTEPVDGHEFILPYSNGTIELTGRITNVKDVYVRLRNGGIHWKGITFDVIGNHPTKTMSLDETLTRGAATLPTESDVSVGEVYIYTSEGWDTLEDADENYY